MVQTKTEFDAFPLHLKGDGSVITRPTVVAPDPPETDDKVVIREAYARDLVRYEGWVDVRAKLKNAILKSALPVDLVALRDPVHGDLLLQIPRILAHLLSFHGEVTADDLKGWKAELL
jgi:hypothetical protein